MKKINCVNCEECCFGEICKAYVFHRQDDLFIKNLSKKKKVAKGEFIYRQGDCVVSLFALRSGIAKIYDMEHNLQGVVLPGQVIGAEELVASRYQHNVQAATEVEVCELQCSQFYELSQVTLGFTDFIVRILSRSAREKQQFISVLTKGEALQKVRDFLHLLSDTNKEHGFEHRNVELPINKKELAQLLGISPSTLTRALDTLVEQRVVEMSKKEITLLD